MKRMQATAVQGVGARVLTIHRSCARCCCRFGLLDSPSCLPSCE